MTEPSSEDPAEAAQKRRRMRERVFGDVLPETTSDDRDLTADGSAGGAHDPSDAADPSDAWLRANVPPHHG